MKAIVFCLLLAMSAASLKAQIRNTKWDGSIKGDNPRAVLLDFRKDSVTIYDASDHSVVERMTYSAKNGLLILHKIDGQSDCDKSTTGKYRYVAQGMEMTIMLSEDPCSDRSTALDATLWKKRKR